MIASLVVVRDIISMTFSRNGLPVLDKDIEGKSTLASKRKTIMHYAPILEKNPFGAPMKLRPISVERQETEKVYSSLGDLTLIGTAVGPPRLSYAIFEEKSRSSGQKQEVFSIGEEVFTYGVLRKIEKISVEIERDSTIHRVTMPEEGLKQPLVYPDSKVIENTGSQFAKKIGEKQYLLDRRKVQQALENPEQILTDARLLPNFKDGRQEGFAMSEVIPGGIYHSLGLRNGDILLRINGLEMSNPEVAIQAMSALRGMDAVTLDIIRRGNNMSMSYQIR